MMDILEKIVSFFVDIFTTDENKVSFKEHILGSLSTCKFLFRKSFWVFFTPYVLIGLLFYLITRSTILRNVVIYLSPTPIIKLYAGVYFFLGFSALVAFIIDFARFKDLKKIFEADYRKYNYRIFNTDAKYGQSDGVYHIEYRHTFRVISNDNFSDVSQWFHWTGGQLPKPTTLALCNEDKTNRRELNPERVTIIQEGEKQYMTFPIGETLVKNDTRILEIIWENIRPVKDVKPYYSVDARYDVFDFKKHKVNYDLQLTFPNGSVELHKIDKQIEKKPVYSLSRHYGMHPDDTIFDSHNPEEHERKNIRIFTPQRNGLLEAKVKFATGFILFFKRPKYFFRLKANHFHDVKWEWRRV